MPSTSPPHKEDLESLAKIAFPTTYAERVVAAQYGAQKTAKRKVQRAAPKKTMARGPIKKKKQRTAISGRQKTATRRRSR
jgi:hypothetical protein